VYHIRYGEVYWTMMDPVPLDSQLVDRFRGKVMAIVGFEADQVSNIIITSLSHEILPLFLSTGYIPEAYKTFGTLR
jgi:hypothetical protein